MSMIQDRTIQYIKELFRNNSGGHDSDHTLRVYRNAMLIAENEPACNQFVVEMAALLHDADDHKLFHTIDNENARIFLHDNQVPEDEINEICSVINSVSFSSNKDKTPDTLEGMIVQDADRLDAIGAVGIARTFAYGGEHGRPLRESVQHFYDKLLLLKDLMNTETAKKIAERRHLYLESFLKELESELDCSEAELL